MSRAAGLLAGLLRHLLQLGVLSLLLLALYASLGRQLVPLLAEYRAEVEARVQSALQMPVRIGRLEGQWSRLAPHLLAHDVVLGEGADAMRLERIRVVVDVFESVWQRQPVLYAVEIEGPRLGLVQQADGGWRVRGLPERGGEPPEVGPIIAGLQRLPRLTIYNGLLTLEPQGSEPHTLTYVDLQLASAGQRMRLEGRALLPDGQPVALNVKARVTPERWQQASAQVYLNLPQSQWADWIPGQLTGAWRVESLRGGGEVWLDWRDRALRRSVLRLNAAEVTVSQEGQAPAALTALGLTAFLDRSETGYRLLLDELAFERNGSRWGEVQIGLEQTRDDQQALLWHLWANRLQLGPLVPLVEALVPLPPEARAWLVDLQPQGTLRNLSFRYRPEGQAGERLQYAFNLDGVSMAERGWVPAAGNVSGAIQGDLAGGELRLDAPDSSLHLARLFPEPWAMRSARGRLRWSIDADAVTLVAPYLAVDSEAGEIAGDFLIRLRFDPAAEDYMDLRVGMRDGDARFAGQFLPSLSPAMSAPLAQWLRDAIRGGTVEQGYFLYQGALSADLPAEARQVSLYFEVSDAELDYRPGWPALQQGQGEILVENGHVQVRLSEGRVLNSRVHGATAEVERPAAGEAPRIVVEGQVAGPLSDGLKVLRESPLGLAELFDGWEVTGETDATLALDIPLQADLRPRVVVDFPTRAATLSIPHFAVTLDQLEGRFRYDTDKGFSGEELRARLLNEAVSGRAVAIGEPGRPATRIEAKGAVEVQRLQDWLGIDQALPVSGRLPYQMRLTLDGADSRLQVDSSLRGVVVDLPAPFAKDRSSARHSSLTMTLQGSERRYWAEYGDLAALTLAAPPGEWRSGRGELRLGEGPARLPTGAGLRVRGQLPVLELAAWRALLPPASGMAGEAGAPGGAVPVQPPAYLREAKLAIGRFEGFGTTLENLELELGRRGDSWSLALASERLRGVISQKTATDVLDVHLASVRLPAPTPAPAAANPVAEPQDPLAAVDPGRLPAMDVRVDQLWRGDELLGAVRGRVRPLPQAARFEGIDAQLRGLHLTGEMTWRPAQTHYKGWIEGKDIGEVLAAWGFAPSATSERFGLGVDGSWPGSPGFFSFDRLSGRLEPSLRNGRFVEVDGGAQALRMFGLLNFNSIGRRLRLDFSDLLGRGLTYDRVHGVLVADTGVYVTQSPLELTGPSSNLELNGTLNLAANRIDAKLLVTLPVSNNLPLAAILAGAPAVAGALWVADRLLGDRMARFATVQYDVKGPWQSPEITFDKPFESPN